MIIGLIGKKGSGKDTLADYLVSDYQYQKRAFADPLKKVVQELFLIDRTHLYDQNKKEIIDERWGLSPRQMMQMVGTDLVRERFGLNFWLKHMDLFMTSSPNKNLVISDVRFQNEALWVKEKGGILVRIKNPNSAKSTEDSHVSENELEEIEFDHLISNDKTKGKPGFYQQIDELIQRTHC